MYPNPISAIKGKRLLIAKTLMGLGVLHLCNLKRGTQLNIYNYHRIMTPGMTSLFDDTSFGPTADKFRMQLLLLKKHADPITEADLIQSIDGKIKLPKRSFMITFDDGYKDNYTLAFPILKELGISGNFFIPTDTIERRQLGWWDQIYYLLKSAIHQEFTFRGDRLKIQVPLLPVAEYFNELMKRVPSSETDSLIEELAAACGAEIPNLELSDKQLMTWKNILEMDQNGMTIGSHSHSHRVMATLPLNVQKEELVKSKAFLEMKLGHPVHSFAYPVGGYEHFNLETKKLCLEAGYKVAYSFLTGVNLNHQIDPYDVKRIDQCIDPQTLFATLVLPKVFGRRTCIYSEPLPYSHTTEKS